VRPFGAPPPREIARLPPSSASVADVVIVRFCSNENRYREETNVRYREKTAGNRGERHGHLTPSVHLAVGGVAALTLLLSGCAGLPGYPVATDTPLGQLVDGVDCQASNLNNWIVAPEGGSPRTDRTSAHPDAPKPGMVPTGFEPVAAYRCTFRGSVDNSEGRWSAVTVETLEGDFDPLLKALAAVNDRTVPNQVCSADIEFVPELWLENANGDALSDIEGRPFDDEALSTMISLQFGTFASATTLSADAAALLPAAASAEKATECTAALTRFAVLWPTRGGAPLGNSIQVEQDGCRRVFLPGSHALVPSPTLLAALDF